MSTDTNYIDSYNRFISLIAKRYDKSMWSRLPERTRAVFHTYNNIEKWISKASDREKMFFLQDLGMTTAMVVFPDNNLNLNDIPELSDFFFTVENRIISVQKQLERNYFALTTRELAVYFYNMSQNSNSKYFMLKQNFAALDEANQNAAAGTYKSAGEYKKNTDIRESILEFISNVLADFNAQRAKELSIPSITLLFHMRKFNETGVKLDTLLSLFKGSLGQRQIYNYLSLLKKRGLILSTGKKTSAVYTLSSTGMLFVQDYCDKILSL